MGIGHSSASNDNFERNEYITDNLRENVSFMNNLKEKVLDLQFIVQHLREDLQCTLESGGKSFKSVVESEVGLLVYSMLEESVREREGMKENNLVLENENALLIENECGLMDELARLTIENDHLKQILEAMKETKKETSIIQSPIVDLKDILLGLNELEVGLFEENWIPTFYNDSKIQNERLLAELTERGNCVESLQNEISGLKESKLMEKEMMKEELSNAHCKMDVKEAELEVMKGKFDECELKMKELLQINCELMDLTEKAKVKTNSLTHQIDEFSNRNQEQEKEIELLKTAVTTQKIELERSREALSRERKLNALKISDLTEQLHEKNMYSNAGDENICLNDNSINVKR